MFQSTHSLRSATHVRIPVGGSPDVSIHALLAECDNGAAVKRQRGNSFNPRTPCGVRRMTILASPPLARFQSTHSLRSATVSCTSENVISRVSIHALLAECDLL